MVKEVIIEACLGQNGGKLKEPQVISMSFPKTRSPRK